MHVALIVLSLLVGYGPVPPSAIPTQNLNGTSPTEAVEGTTASDPDALGNAEKSSQRSVLEILGLLGIGGLITTVVSGWLKHWLSSRQESARSRRSARSVVDSHLDPILKSAEEVVAKVNALAVQDFKPLFDPQPPELRYEEFDHLSFYYTLIHFWARLEILRLEATFTNLADDKKRGAKLISCLRAIESRRIRLLSREEQRVLAEMLIEHGDSGYRCLTIVEFLKAHKSDSFLRQWTGLLAPPEKPSALRRWRQHVLHYGAVVHAMLRQLDPENKITRAHRLHVNKMTEATRESIRYRLIENYMPELKDDALFGSI